jgi:uncharacterized protein involved in outer membrane biogenesis
MRWIKGVLAALVLLAIAALALPFFVSLDTYLPLIEKAASDKLGQPVTVRALHLALLPLPHVTADDIRVGTDGAITLAAVRAYPDLWSLASSTRVIRSLELDSPSLNAKGIALLEAAASTAPSAAPAPVRIRNIRLKGARVDFGPGRFGPFDGRLTLDDDGEPSAVSVSTEDGKLNADITPAADGYLIDAHATDWTLPAGPPIVVDELTLKGTATLKDAAFDTASAKLYGGTVNGKLRLAWHTGRQQKGLQLAGQFDVEHVETQRMVSLLSPKTHVSGQLFARPVLSAAAAAPDQLLNALRVDTPFRVQNGVIHGVDIEKAATSIIHQGSSGGETRFEQLSGHLLMEHGAFHFTSLSVASGALSADGNVDISAGKELGGRINANVKALGVSTGVPLNVAGTLDSPLLYPTGATLAGAAVGTAVMGPGLGTSVGAKVGGWAEDLFGKKDKPKK